MNGIEVLMALCFHTLRLMEWNNVTNDHNSYFIPLLFPLCSRTEKSEGRKRGGKKKKKTKKLNDSQTEKKEPLKFEQLHRAHSVPVAHSYTVFKEFRLFVYTCSNSFVKKCSFLS